jgi:hypothetical protein
MFQQDNPGYLSGVQTMGGVTSGVSPSRHFSDVIRVGYGSENQVQSVTAPVAPQQAGQIPAGQQQQQQQPKSPGVIQTGIGLVGSVVKIGVAAVGSGVSSGVVGAILPKYTFKDGFQIGAYGAIIYGVAGLILKGVAKPTQQ